MSERGEAILICVYWPSLSNSTENLMIKKSPLLFSTCSFVLIFLLFSCNSTTKINKDFLYFSRGLDSLGSIQMKENIIKVNDLLGIHVSSKSRNQEQAALFNMASDSVGYQVTNAGTIDVPVLGYVKVAGLTKVQLQTLLTEKLSPYVKDPLVIVRFNQFNVNVLGEVRSPGTKTFGTDKVSIIDAISESGDMTDFGKKEKVVVIREENGKRNYYSLDLRSGAVFQSPAYFLQPNDIVYVEPNDFRLKTLAIDPNKQTNRSNLQFFISLGLTFAALAVTLIRLK